MQPWQLTSKLDDQLSFLRLIYNAVIWLLAAEQEELAVDAKLQNQCHFYERKSKISRKETRTHGLPNHGRTVTVHVAS